MATVSDPKPDWLAIVMDIRSTIIGTFGADPLPWLVQQLSEHIDRATDAWRMRVDYASSCDRLGNLISAPLFTSEKYPWPTGTEQEWAEPILQVDLKWLGEIAGLNLGSELLQVWGPEPNPTLRTVPRSELGSAMVAPVPDLESGAYDWGFADKPFEVHEPPVWLLTPGTMSLGEKFFDTAPWHLAQKLSFIVTDEVELQRSYPPGFEERLHEIWCAIQNVEPDDPHRFFGMCGGSIFQQTENDTPVLLTVEIDDRVHGILGETFCVYFEKDKGGLQFKSGFFWS